jgi:hypothetical protein
MLLYRLRSRLRCYLTRLRYGPFAETPDSPPIVKLAHRIIEDSYCQGAADVRFILSGDKVKVRYLARGEWRDQMDLPQRCFVNLLDRYREMTQGSDEIAYEKFNPKYNGYRLRVKLPHDSDSNEFGFIPLRDSLKKPKLSV